MSASLSVGYILYIANAISSENGDVDADGRNGQYCRKFIFYEFFMKRKFLSYDLNVW